MAKEKTQEVVIVAKVLPGVLADSVAYALQTAMGRLCVSAQPIENELSEVRRDIERSVREERDTALRAQIRGELAAEAAKEIEDAEPKVAKSRRKPAEVREGAEGPVEPSGEDSGVGRPSGKAATENP